MISVVKTIYSAFFIYFYSSSSVGDELSYLYYTYKMSLLFLLIISVGFYAIKSVAVCITAKKQNISYWWLGAVPFANFFVIGKLAGPVRFFRIDFKNFGLITAILCSAMIIVDLLYIIFVYGDFVVGFINNNVVFQQLNEITVEGEFLDEQYALLNTNMMMVSIFDSVSYFLNLCYRASFFVLSLSFFKKYKPEKAMLFAILSIIQPIFAILLLICRNNKPQSYEDFLKERMAKRYGQSYNPYSNPFSTRDNPYEYKQDNDPFGEYSNDTNGTNNSNNSNNSNDNPFSDY